MKLPQTFAAMPPRAKAGIAAGALAVVVVLFLLLRIAGAPSYAILANGLDPADTGKVTEALDKAGISYELEANGTTVSVQKPTLAQARVALAQAGVSAGAGSGGPGFELFDEQKLGASDFQQQVTYQRALEGEIARTIGSVDGVPGAQVQLVLPEDDLFADEATPATAAVLLDGPGDMLDPGAVRGIAQLTSSSVQGLDTDNVTITDSTGQVLWPQGDGAGGAADGATAKAAAETRYAAQLEQRVGAMLTRTLGPNKAQVQIHAELDMDKVTRDELRYAEEGVPLKTTTEDERLRGGGGTTGGVAGTAGNIPQVAQAGAGGGSSSNYSHKSESTDFGVDKTVSKVEQAPGSVERLSVALMTDSSVENPEAVQSAVAAAVGLDEDRGDTITQAATAFPKVEEPKAGPVPVGMIGPIKYGLLGLAVALFSFFTWRGLRKREKEDLPQPAWLREFDEPVRLSELEAGATRELAPLPARQKDEGLHKLDQLMDREPARVAAQVRQWMNED